MTKPIFATLASVVALTACAQAVQAQSTQQGSGAQSTLPPVVVKQKKDAASTAAPKKSKPQSSASSSDSGDSPKAKPAKKASAPQSAPPPSGAPEAVEVKPLTQAGAAATGLAVPESTTTITGAAIADQRPATSNTAQLLTQAPGVSIYQAGGVSGLPVINGLNDDRVKILLSGMAVTSACANHMNPPLSYADPANVGAIEVVGGVTPVSKGGDSIAGTIIVEPAAPRFAAPGEGTRLSGSASAFYRSNGHGIATSATGEAATENFSMSYTGAWTRADQYKDGNGNTVTSTEYEAANHAVRLAMRDGGNLFIVQGGVQYMPYQGFVNQRMDLIDNHAQFINTRWVGRYGWGVIDARFFAQHTSHEMNFLEDKKFNTTPARNMPMRTEGHDIGYSIKADIPVSSSDLIRVGNELHRQTLDDWWPATMMMVGMMGPNTYVTINDGERTRLGTFLEWEKKWTRAWTTLVGVRNDVVWMDTGDVQGYNNSPMSVYVADANAFNAREHARTDVNFDATALVRFEPDLNSTYEAGYARKTRSPNFYERYAWSRKYNGTPMGTAQMAMNMIGWFGDGNGYTGNLDLNPEVAHTISFTTGWHDGARKDWGLKITPYFTYVEDFIGVRKIGNSVGAAHAGFVDLQFANHDAVLYGANAEGFMPLLTSPAFGRFMLTGVAGYVHGENADTHVSLYHMMPLHGTLALTHQIGGWSSAIEVKMVAGKHNVDTVREELKTGAYALVNLRTRYEVGNFRFDLGVENLLDSYYEDPLGGHYLEPTMRPGAARVDKGNVPGMGRSFNAGVTVKF